MAHHVHRTAELGPGVLIKESWYYAISADSDFNNSTGTGASLLAWYEEPAIFGKKIKKRCYDCELQDYLVIYRTHHSQSEELSFLLTTKD
jgi:hypothetical protein